MNLYKQVLGLITPYFNTPVAAEVFLKRQCQQHLNCEPADLGPHNLWELAKWAMISGSLFVGKEKAEEMSDKIRNLRKSMGQVPLVK